MTPAQCRAARELLGWTQANLATEAGIGLSTVKDFELSKREPLPHNLTAMENAIVKGGIQLLDDGAASDGGGIGARLAKRAKAKAKTK